MDTHQYVKVAVGIGGVGNVDGSLVVLQGSRGTPLVAVGTTQHVVGPHAVIARMPPMVVVVDNRLYAVDTERHVCAVHLLESFQLLFVVNARTCSEKQNAENAVKDSSRLHHVIFIAWRKDTIKSLMFNAYRLTFLSMSDNALESSKIYMDLSLHTHLIFFAKIYRINCREGVIN